MLHIDFWPMLRNIGFILTFYYLYLYYIESYIGIIYYTYIPPSPTRSTLCIFSLTYVRLCFLYRWQFRMISLRKILGNMGKVGYYVCNSLCVLAMCPFVLPFFGVAMLHLRHIRYLPRNISSIWRWCIFILGPKNQVLESRENYWRLRVRRSTINPA